MNVEDIIEKLPKIELHCHLDGSIRPETVQQIAKEENIPLPTEDIVELSKLLKVEHTCSSLKEYLTKFDLTLKVMQKPQQLYRITLELLEDSARVNIKYIEIRFSPVLLMEGGMKFEEIVDSILAAMKEGRKKYGILSNLILICMRHHPLETSIEIVKKGRAYLNNSVVGIDLAGNEHDFPPELHKEAFDIAKNYGYHITVHAGETGIEKNIVTSIKELHAERIGHGVYAFKDENIIRLLKDRNVALEMCISSNVHTMAVESFENHPIKKYLDQGIKVTVNTDNNTVSNTNLNKEYKILIKKQNFSIEDLKKTIFNGIEASFAKNEEKEYLRELCTKEISNVEATLQS